MPRGAARVVYQDQSKPAAKFGQSGDDCFRRRNDIFLLVIQGNNNGKTHARVSGYRTDDMIFHYESGNPTNASILAADH